MVDNIVVDSIMVDNIVVDIVMDSFMVGNILVNNSMVDRMGIIASMISMAVLVGQVFCLHGSHTGLIKRGDGSIGMGLQAVKALRGSQGLVETGGENQKLHDC